MEHHSNDLPWRKHAEVIHVGITREGHLDLTALRAALRRHAGRVKLVAVSGASNITGLCSPIHDIARWAHEVGARIFVDAAQLAPHRAIDLLPDGDPGHLDFLSFSAHKMYAPFGTGALVGPTAFFEQGAPDAVGGGVVDVVTLENAVWNHPPHKEEAGSPNVIGGVALAAAIAVLQRVGMDAIAAHEHELLEYAYERLRTLNGVVCYGPVENLAEKVGVVTLNVEGVHHALTAAILSLEGGIGVRNGCFCAHPYVKQLLGVSADDDRRLTAEVLSGNKSNMPGMVRASFGCYSTKDDVDALVDMLGRIVKKEYRGTYVQNRASGAFAAEGFSPRYSRYFAFADLMAPSVHHGASEAS